MRHHVYGRKLNRTSKQRKALFRSLAVALFTHGRIDTTEAKAKAVQPWVEKLVTRSKTNNLSSRRLLLSDLPNQQVVDSLLTKVGPAFSSRPGGYTRLTRIGNRFGDNAMIVRLELVEEVKGLVAQQLKEQKSEPVAEQIEGPSEDDKPKAKSETKSQAPVAVKDTKATKTAPVKQTTQRKTPDSGK